MAYTAEIGHRLASARRRAGLSQERVASVAGISKYTLGLLELGRSAPRSSMNPTLRTLVAVSQALNANLHDLLPESAPDLTDGR